MKILLRWAGAGALALAPAPAPAQAAGSSVQFPAGYATGNSPCVKLADGSCAPVSLTNPLPITDGPLAAATSTALTGTTAIGPFTPQLGGGIRVILSTGGRRLQQLHYEPSGDSVSDRDSDVTGRS